MQQFLPLLDIIRDRRTQLIQERQEHALNTMVPASLTYLQAKATDTAYGTAINELDLLIASANPPVAPTEPREPPASS